MFFFFLGGGGGPFRINPHYDDHCNGNYTFHDTNSVVYENKTNHPMSSNRHPTAAEDNLRNFFKGGEQKQKRDIIEF